MTSTIGLHVHIPTYMHAYIPKQMLKKRKKNKCVLETWGGDYYTFMSLKFFLYTFRFWKRAAANGETGRPIWDMHSVSLNNINI